MKKWLLLMITGLPCLVSANADSLSLKSLLTFSAYLDAYYGYDFSNPANHQRPFFLYNHTRHNEVNINLAYIKAAYNDGTIRFNLALMAGTYAQYNLVSEPDLLKHVFEANAGIRLSKHHNLWVDAGVLPSHIGSESAISKDCWTLTRSLMAENSPYYESGAKITYTTPDEKWTFSTLALNGWQRIKRVDGNNTLAAGTQIVYKPSSKITLNYSTFIGNDKPDSIRQMRYFNNFYGMFQLTRKLGVIAAFDIGMEQKSKGSSEYNLWFSPLVIAKYTITDKLAIAGRAEYYYDKNGVVIPTGTVNGFQTYGYSANIDYSPVKKAVVRMEAHALNSKDAIFTLDGQSSHWNYFLVSSIAVAIN